MLPAAIGLFLVSSYCVAEPALENLYGVEGGNKVTACVSAPHTRACFGAAWMQNFVVVRKSCLEGTGAAPITIWKGDINCSKAAKEKSASRNVLARYIRPKKTDDLELLSLDLPYLAADPLDNRTATSNLLKKLALWVDEIYQHTTENPYLRTKVQGYYNNHYLKMYSSPLRMFLVTVVLPSSAFILFFIIAIFFTGSNKSKIVYKSLQNEKEESAHV